MYDTLRGCAQAGAAPATAPSADNTLSRETRVFPPTGEGARSDYRHHAPRQTGTELGFRIDQTLDHIVIKVLQPDTGEVISESVAGELSSVTPGSTTIETGQLIHAITWTRHYGTGAGTGAAHGQRLS